jgi:hypothetical protein
MNKQTSSEPNRFRKLEVPTESGVQYREAEATDCTDATDKLLRDAMRFLRGITVPHVLVPQP